MGLLRQETRLFAALWLGTMNDMVPEAGDAREVSNRLFEAGDSATTHVCEHTCHPQKTAAIADDETTFEHHSSWVH